MEKGLTKNPNIISGHISNLNIIKTGRYQSITPLEYMEKVPGVVKKKYAVWSHLLQTIIPRWGGRNEEILQTIESVIPEFMSNISKIEAQTMKDTITYDAMMTAVSDGKYLDALKMGEKSINKGSEYAGIFEFSSNAAQQIKDYKKCYQYGKIAATMRPFRSEGWRRTGFCATKLQKWGEANEAYRYKLHIDGATVYSVFQLGVTYMYLHQYDKAYAMFKKSEELDFDYKKYTKQYTGWIESDQKNKMNLVGKDIYEIIGNVTYKDAIFP